MKAKQTQVKKYSSTQIKMLVERMVRENQSRAKAALEPIHKAWESEATKKRDTMIHSMTVSAGMRRLLKNELSITNDKVQKTFALPKEPQDANWHLRIKIEALGENFKFDLTMADAGDYEKHMKAFAAAVDKLLNTGRRWEKTGKIRTIVERRKDVLLIEEKK